MMRWLTDTFRSKSADIPHKFVTPTGTFAEPTLRGRDGWRGMNMTGSGRGNIKNIHRNGLLMFHLAKNKKKNVKFPQI